MKKIKTNKFFYAHSSINGKRKFICKQILFFFLFLFCLLASTFLFFVYGENNSNVKNVFLILGIVVLILSLMAYLIYNIVEVNFFYLSQKKFFMSNEFKLLKQNALKQIKHASKKQLKQYYILKLIDKQTYKDYLNKATRSK